MTVIILHAALTIDKNQSCNVCGALLAKIMRWEGLTPETDSWAKCSKSADLDHFSVERAAFFCGDCAGSGMIHTLPSTRESIEAIFDGRLAAVIDNIPAVVAHEIETLAVAMIEHHTGHGLRAVSVS